MAAYVAYDLQENSCTAQCSSLGLMSPTPELSPATVFKSDFLRRLQTEGDNSEKNVKSTSFEKRRIDVHLGSAFGSFNNMEHATGPSLKAGVLDVVEASVNKASAWEHKAKAAVDLLRTPSRYDVSLLPDSLSCFFSFLNSLLLTSFFFPVSSGICEGPERRKALYGRHLLYS